MGTGIKTFYQTQVKAHLIQICAGQIDKIDIVEYSPLNFDIMINDKNKNNVNNCEELIFKTVKNMNLNFYNIVDTKLKFSFLLLNQNFNIEKFKLDNNYSDLFDFIDTFKNKKDSFLLVKKINNNRNNLKSNTFRLENLQTYESIIGILILIQIICIFFYIRSDIKKNKIINKFSNYLK